MSIPGDGLKQPVPDREAVEKAFEAAPESRRLRICELALVVGVGFLLPTVYALTDWWTGTAVPPDTSLTNLFRILKAGLSIGVLAYVLYRRGDSLRTIGLTFRRSDIALAFVLLFFESLMSASIYRVIGRSAGGPASGPSLLGQGLLAWLAIIPSAAEEELLVRAFLMMEVAALTGSMGIAVFASVAFQTLYHVYLGLPAAFLTAGLFFVSAVFYAYTRRITPVILAHSLHNFLIMSRHW